ncbi:hypothetical protein N0B40_02070 [Chryseobacterium oranimense]|uniref:hypothetical protein n=1 Tax=Chryseobacterium oranimense TaxID=421058 RepID=UPI0021AF0DEC|nr:hypothetical protein [Chryseobacterium oranimense]UWX61067.1 hypothetical protein N0B40_02070 [Chryseobacterium oranimense]
MPISGNHIKNYKALILVFVLVFSLSPCSLKRDFLSIFDIQHISGLNKVKITSSAASCVFSAETSSSRINLSKAYAKLKNIGFIFHSGTDLSFREEKITFQKYSGHTSGNSPPKYILFKRLKLTPA